MEQALMHIAYLGLFLLIGILCIKLASCLKMPNSILLIVAGIITGSVTYAGIPVIKFSDSFICYAASMIASVFVFDAAARLNFKRFTTIAEKTFEFSVMSFVVNMAFFSGLVYYVLKPDSLLAVIIFAAAVSGASYIPQLVKIAKQSLKLSESLKFESIMSFPLAVIASVFLIGIFSSHPSSPVLFAQQLAIGIGTGFLFYIFSFSLLRSFPALSGISFLAIALPAFFVAEALGGNGVLSAGTAGILFGNFCRVNERKKHALFGEAALEAIKAFVFILLGLLMQVNWTFDLVLISALLFALYIIVRFLLVFSSSLSSMYATKEKMYFVLSSPKGAAAAVIFIMASTKSAFAADPLITLIALFIIYSIILSIITSYLYRVFVK